MKLIQFLKKANDSLQPFWEIDFAFSNNIFLLVKFCSTNKERNKANLLNAFKTFKSENYFIFLIDHNQIEIVTIYQSKINYSQKWHKEFFQIFHKMIQSQAKVERIYFKIVFINFQ
jgi:hypothetical protein